MVERRQTIAGRLCKSDGGERIPADFPDFPAQTTCFYGSRRAVHNATSYTTEPHNAQ